MRASVFVGTSVDGFLARPDGSYDFLPADDGEPHGYVEFMATVDALVIGRKTFDTVLGFDPWPYHGKPVFVLTTRPLPRLPPGVLAERVEGDVRAVAARLSALGFAHIYVDGGVTIQQFLRAGLVQRLIITRVPVLIGTGVPLFGATPHDIVLEHVATRQYPGGLVQTEYTVAG